MHPFRPAALEGCQLFKFLSMSDHYPQYFVYPRCKWETHTLFSPWAASHTPPKLWNRNMCDVHRCGMQALLPMQEGGQTCVTTVKQGQVKSHNLRWQVGSRFWPSRRHGSETWKAIAIAGHVSSAFLSGKHVSLLYKRAMKPIRSIHLCRWMAGEKKTDKENNFYPANLFYNFFLFIYQENMKKKICLPRQKNLFTIISKKTKKNERKW